MFVSVIIPTYNRVELVQQTLKSVFDQNFDDFEVIVIDNGSTDGTEKVLPAAFNRTNFHYFWQENQGRSRGRNNGLAKATGDYVMFLDSDDLLAPEALRVLSEVACEHKDSAVIAGSRLYIDEANRFLSLNDELLIEKEFFDRQLTWEKVRKIYFCMGSYIIKRDLALSLDGFNPNIEPVEDYDFFIRYCNFAKISAVKTPVVYIRQHEGNMQSVYLFNALMNLAQQNFELLDKESGSYSPHLIKKTKAEWQLKMADYYYAFRDNSQSLKHYFIAMKIEPKLLFDKNVVKATLKMLLRQH